MTYFLWKIKQFVESVILYEIWDNILCMWYYWQWFSNIQVSKQIWRKSKKVSPNKILQESVRFCKILQDSTRFFNILDLLQDSPRFCMILQNSARFCKIQQDSARFHKILQDSARLHMTAQYSPRFFEILQKKNLTFFQNISRFGVLLLEKQRCFFQETKVS